MTPKFCVGYSKESGRGLNFSEPIHRVTIGKTGSGKSSKVLIPLLLTWPQSMIVIDPMAELAGVTAHARKRFGKVKLINPFKMHLDEFPPDEFEHVGYNPMRILDPKSNLFNALATKIASGCVIRGKSRDPYWDDSALDLVKGVIMAESILSPTANLGEVAKIITGNVPAYAQAVLNRTNNSEVRAALSRYLPKEKKQK